MAEVLEKLPQGCDHTIDILNRLPTEVFSDICHDVLFFLQFKIPAIDIETLKERFEENNIHIEDKDLQSILHILKYIYKSAGKLKVHHDSLKKQLLSSLKFTEETSENIAYNWKEYGDVLRSDHSFPMFDVGKLIDMQWKLGVAVSSDDCRNLNSTFVAMTLKVADTSGNLTSHAFEMTIPQFKNLSKQLQEMAKSMEMV
ncbi:COMM domain-containing protein 6-like [Mytilus galloprovincialis]|uniref:COMM domain-containing protein 6-like n=1 Tax=Mytilus galloprovincialis TaxID=29158 RepID=UPI003F7B67B8